jgi:uncharacterized membrane protein
MRLLKMKSKNKLLNKLEKVKKYLRDKMKLKCKVYIIFIFYIVNTIKFLILILISPPP